MRREDVTGASGRPALLLEGGLVLALDDAGTTGRLSVAVAGRRIAGVGPEEELRREFGSAERIDCAGRVLLPGLVNAHLHPEAHVLKGLVEDLSLHEWAHADRFNRAIALLGSEHGRWVQRAAIRAALAESLLCGTTRVGTYGVTVGSDAVAAEEMAALGLPGHVTIRDIAFAPVRAADGSQTIPAAALDPPRMYRLHAEEALTPAELEAAAAAHARGERIVMHAAETRHRVELAAAGFGATTIRLLDRYDLLSSRMLLSHAVHVDEEERALIAARGAVVISSPAAEMKLADGLAPVADFLERGVTVALGTDSAVCNNSGDLLLECRLLGLSQKVAAGAHALPADRILRCATSGGARALGEADERGAIAPGLAADLVLLDAHNLRAQPLIHDAHFSNVAANLVYAATGQDVTDVLIGGRWVVRHRRLRTADQDALADDLARAARHLHDRLD